jgi:hypothetical protein
MQRLMLKRKMNDDRRDLERRGRDLIEHTIPSLPGVSAGKPQKDSLRIVDILAGTRNRNPQILSPQRYCLNSLHCLPSIEPEASYSLPEVSVNLRGHRVLA